MVAVISGTLLVVVSVDSLMGETEKKRFVELFRELIRTRNILISFTDFTFEDTNITEQDFEDFKSKYLDLYFERHNDTEKDSILDEVDFELELIRRDEINVDYILRLLAKMVDASDSEKRKISQQIDGFMRGEEKLRSKRGLIEKFINGWLPKIKNRDKVETEFEKFWSEEEGAALDRLGSEYGFDPEKLRRLISEYSYTNC